MDRCETCGHDLEQHARFVVRVREVEKQRDRALARAAIAEAKLELAGLEDKAFVSRMQSKIEKQKVELRRHHEALAAARARRSST